MNPNDIRVGMYVRANTAVGGEMGRVPAGSRGTVTYLHQPPIAWPGGPTTVSGNGAVHVWVEWDHWMPLSTTGTTNAMAVQLDRVHIPSLRNRDAVEAWLDA